MSKILLITDKYFKEMGGSYVATSSTAYQLINNNYKVKLIFFDNGISKKKYDLFKFKGGIYCRHKWKEILYRLKEGTELKNGQSLDDDYNKVNSIPKSYVRNPKGLKDSKIAPVNMPNQGAYPGAK